METKLKDFLKGAGLALLFGIIISPSIVNSLILIANWLGLFPSFQYGNISGIGSFFYLLIIMLPFLVTLAAGAAFLILTKKGKEERLHFSLGFILGFALSAIIQWQFTFNSLGINLFIFAILIMLLPFFCMKLLKREIKKIDSIIGFAAGIVSGFAGLIGFVIFIMAVSSLFYSLFRPMGNFSVILMAFSFILPIVVLGIIGSLIMKKMKRSAASFTAGFISGVIALISAGWLVIVVLFGSFI